MLKQMSCGANRFLFIEMVISLLGRVGEKVFLVKGVEKNIWSCGAFFVSLHFLK
jgi:hypothetical protein